MSGTVYHKEVLLRVEDLGVAARGDDGRPLEIVRGVDLSVEAGEFVALLGESGSGKSMTVAGILDLLPSGARRSRGRIAIDDDFDADPRIWRGRAVGLVMQDAQSSLNPVLSLGAHLIETLEAVRGLDPESAREAARELLERVAMPDPARRLGAYAHELSGGQRQRAMIALALAGRPSLLIADEPTTALDVTLQAQILDLLAELRRDLDLAILLITHDLAVVASYAERAMVMFAGEIVETATVERLFTRPAHPYTIELLAARPGRRDTGRHAPGRREPGRRDPDLGDPGLGDPEGQPEPPTTGCRFAPRCAWVRDACRIAEPTLVAVGGGHRSRCFRTAEILEDTPGSAT